MKSQNQWLFELPPLLPSASSNEKPSSEAEFETVWTNEESEKETSWWKKAAAIGRIVGLLANPPQEPVLSPPEKPVIVQGPGVGDGKKKPKKNREFEWEMMRSSSRKDYLNSLMEYLSKAAAETESEAEATTLVASLLPIAAHLLPESTPVLIRSTPMLIQGLTAATQDLHRNPQTRPLLRALPSILRRTAISVNEQLAHGKSVHPRTAAHILANHAYEVLNHSSSSDFEMSTQGESSTVVLQSPRFRNDSRLQIAANNRPPMRQGERGLAVQKLQQALIDLGFPMPISTRRRGSPDGIYGSETATMVRKFQQKYGLKVDGVAGRETLSKLDQLFSSSGTGSCEIDCERQFQGCVPMLGQTECRRRFRRCIRDCRGVPV